MSNLCTDMVLIDGELLREDVTRLKVNLNWTIEGISKDLLGCGKNGLSTYMSKRRMPKSRLEKLCRFLNTEPEKYMVEEVQEDIPEEKPATPPHLTMSHLLLGLMQCMH